MKKHLIWPVLLCGLVVFSQNKTNSELWLMPSEDYVTENSYVITAQNWDFEVKALDKIQAQFFKDSLDAHNRALWQQIENRGVDNAEQKFMAEMDQVKEKVQQAVTLSLNHAYINDIYGKIKRQNLQSKTVIQRMTEFEYRFMIYSFEKHNTQTSELRFVVDLRDNSIRMFK